MQSIGRFFSIAIGIIAVIVGAIFTGQGSNLIKGSAMTGSNTWLVIGLILLVIGVILIVTGARRPKKNRS